MKRSNNRFAAAVASPWRPRRTLAFATALFLAVFLGAACRQHQYTGTVFEDPNPASPIRGQNYDGAPFDLAQLIGDPVLLFFGYTFCPDICPLTMMELAAAKEALERKAPALGADLKVVFVSVDPQRDSPARLEPYIHAFDSRFFGVRVPENELEALKKGYGLYTGPAEGHSLDDEYYLLDHTSRVFLIDREGNWRALFGADVTAEALAADLQELIR
ncbi:MAG: SCO family protein [Caldilineaceae bacterium]|nr:SCO family protein [Caldilineaceae bacterium]